MVSQAELLQTAQRAAYAGARVLKNKFNHLTTIGSKDNKSYNLVTDADIAAERAIVAVIKKKYPSHSLLTEEAKAIDTHSGYTWIVDPLDGTSNYSHGLPHFAISVGLYKNNKPLLGVVLDVLRNELFYAIKGKGAFIDGRRMRVSSETSLKNSLLATGFYYDRGAMMRRTLKQIKAFFEHGIHGIRRPGVASLDLCYVAAGRLEGFWELHLEPWDFAAGALIVEEAGGKISNGEGKKITLKGQSMIASNSHIHYAMLKIVKK